MLDQAKSIVLYQSKIVQLIEYSLSIGIIDSETIEPNCQYE